MPDGDFRENIKEFFDSALAKILEKSKTYCDGLEVELPAVGSVGFQARRELLTEE
jgi:hypothetical protein